MTNNCIILVDVDTFDLQILELLENVAFDEQEPRIVEDTWGKITSLNNAAKVFGISRNDTVESASEKCQSVRKLRFPVLKTNKPDYKLRRTTTRDLIQCIQQTLPETLVEMASCDEFYIDVTSVVQRRITNNVGWECDRLWGKTCFVENSVVKSHFHHISNTDDVVLVHGALIASELMTKILNVTRLRTSAGVSYNKLVAKLGCNFGKPGGLTIVSRNGGLESLSKNIPLTSVSGLGGKAGEILSRRYKTMADLAAASVTDILEAGEGRLTMPRALTFQAACQGICESKVVSTTYSNNVTVAKQYHEGTVLTRSELQDDLEGIFEELYDRVQEEFTWHKRRARSVTVSIKLENESTAGILVPNVASLEPAQLLSTCWTQFQYADHCVFKMKRIEMVIKKFDFN